MFILCLQNPEFYDYSPQTPDIPFATNYCKTASENCFIVPANFLIKSDDGFTVVENKKSSLKKFSDKIKIRSNKINLATPNAMSDEYSEGVSNYENKLDQRQTDSHKSGTKSKKSKGPKSSFMNYDNKQILVIDNNDIKESTKGVNDVIIVDKKNDVDLVELLGKNWPTNGGEPCEILNSEPGSLNIASSIKANNSTNKNERNKSASFISHIDNKKPDNKNEENSSYSITEMFKGGDRNKSASFISHINNAKKTNSKNDEHMNPMISELTKLDTASGGARTRDVNNSKSFLAMAINILL